MSSFTVLVFTALFSLASWAQYPSAADQADRADSAGGRPDISARVIGQRPLRAARSAGDRGETARAPTAISRWTLLQSLCRMATRSGCSPTA